MLCKIKDLFWKGIGAFLLILFAIVLPMLMLYGFVKLIKLFWYL